MEETNSHPQLHIEAVSAVIESRVRRASYPCVDKFSNTCPDEVLPSFGSRSDIDQLFATVQRQVNLEPSDQDHGAHPNPPQPASIDGNASRKPQCSVLKSMTDFKCSIRSRETSSNPSHNVRRVWTLKDQRVRLF